MVARRRRRDVEDVAWQELSPEELREARLAWWRASRDAQDRALRTGDRGSFLRWLQDNPRPGPDLYAHLRDDPRGRG